MAPESRRAGAGPYREATLTPPARPSAPAAAAGFGGGAFAVVSALRLLFGHATPPAEAPSPYIERASSLAGGARVLAVFADRDLRHPDVLRVPGEPRRSGGDTVVAPEVLAGNGAVAALPDGEHLRDARGEPLRVQGGVVRPLPGAEVAPIAARDALVIERAGDFARLADGTVVAVRGPHAGSTVLDPYPARAIALGAGGGLVCAALEGGRVSCATATRDLLAHPNLSGEVTGLDWADVPLITARDVAQVVVDGDTACARSTGGEVACARLSPSLMPGGLVAERMAPPPGLLRATAIALGGGDLCLLAPDRKLHCVYGPQRDAAGRLAVSPLHFHVAMEGVDEVGLADGLGCARRGGRIECWGPLARGGWVTQRELPVRIEGIEGATAIASAGGLVCALADGAVGCWGMGPDGARHPGWTPVPLPGRAMALWGGPTALCASTAANVRWCWADVGPTAPPPRGPPPGAGRLDALGQVRAPGAFASSGRLRCAIEANGAVSCGRSLSDDEEPSRDPVAGLDDVLSVAVTDGDLACARRREGTVWCWGDNRSGALTAVEAARSPRVVTLTR